MSVMISSVSVLPSRHRAHDSFEREPSRIMRARQDENKDEATARFSPPPQRQNGLHLLLAMLPRPTLPHRTRRRQCSNIFLPPLKPSNACVGRSLFGRVRTMTKLLLVHHHLHNVRVNSTSCSCARCSYTGARRLQC
jgi:hypothetical protein